MPKTNLLVPWIVASLVAHLTGCVPDSTAPRADEPAVRVVGPDQRKPNAPAPRGLTAPEPSPSVPEPSPSEPVKAAMAFRSAGVPAGTTAQLLVAVRIARAHYLHATADHGGTFTPLTVEASLPAGLEFVGDWAFPPPEAGRAGVPVYRDSVLLKRSLRITSPPPQTTIVTGVLRYQACNDELCWPPGRMELSAPLSTPREATP